MSEATARETVDHLLNLVEADIRDRREIVEELDEWDHLSLDSYLAELPLQESSFLQLRDHHQEMTEPQSLRFEEILSGMEEHEANLRAISDRCKWLRKAG